MASRTSTCQDERGHVAIEVPFLVHFASLIVQSHVSMTLRVTSRGVLASTELFGDLCTIQSGVSRSSFRLLIGRLKAPHPHDYYNDSSVRSPLTCLCSFLRCVLIIAVNTGTFLELCPSTRYNDPYYLALLRMLIRLTVPVRRHK